MTNKDAIISMLNKSPKMELAYFVNNFSTMMIAMVRDVLHRNNKPENLADAYKLLTMYDDKNYFSLGISTRCQVATFLEKWLNQEISENDIPASFSTWNLMKNWNEIFWEDQEAKRDEER